MRILYLSCHAILEYDELRLFESLGVEYFSLGSYIRPTEPVDSIRPPLTAIPHPEALRLTPPREALTPEFLQYFDTIIVMHVPQWITSQWNVLQGDLNHPRRVIWRTIGQSTTEVETSLMPFRTKGLEVVRYSPREANIPGTIGCNKIIRFYKDPNEYTGWIGASHEAITIAQDMKHRAQHCNYDIFQTVAQGLPLKVYGPKNEESGDINGGYLHYEEMKQKLRDARVFFYTGTQPASYTLGFIEAMMTGIPIVAVGPQHGNSLNIAGDLYEIPDIIQNGANGYWSDSPEDLQKYIRGLLNNHNHARAIGEAGRKRAIELFGKDHIQALWKEYLGL